MIDTVADDMPTAAPAPARKLLDKHILPAWSLAMPILGAIAIVISLAKMGSFGVAAAGLILIGAVVAAVHHAEVVAHRVGEPFGTLVLAVAVTVIEVSLIISLMTSGGGDAATLARDTVFAAIMIILNGIVGICLLVGGVRHHEQAFGLKGVSAALCVLAAMATLSLILPNYTLSAAGPFFTTSQLIFTACVSLALYATFVLIQTVRHRDYFLPAGDTGEDEDSHAEPPTNAQALVAFGMLVLALISVVLLAKALAPTLEAAVLGAGLPIATPTSAIAALVLAPESLAAVNAARRNRLQTSLNLALGSALATIGLTIPSVAIASLYLELPIALGIDRREITLLALSMMVAVLSLGTGRTTVLQGVVHVLIFATFLFTTIVP